MAGVTGRWFMLAWIWSEYFGQRSYKFLVISLVRIVFWNWLLEDGSEFVPVCPSSNRQTRDTVDE